MTNNDQNLSRFEISETSEDIMDIFSHPEDMDIFSRGDANLPPMSGTYNLPPMWTQQSEVDFDLTNDDQNLSCFEIAQTRVQANTSSLNADQENVKPSCNQQAQEGTDQHGARSRPMLKRVR